jgi:PAS domain S-box-containing protein
VPGLDIRTISVSNMITTVVCLAVVLLLWNRSRRRFSGIGLFVIDYLFLTAGMFLNVLRGTIPDVFSMALSNTLIAWGAFFGYAALGSLIGKRIVKIPNYICLIIFSLIHFYFTVIQPDLTIRNINISAILLIMCLQCVLILFCHTSTSVRRYSFYMQIVFLLYVLLSVVRIIELLTVPHSGNDYFYSGVFAGYVVLAYQMLFILLTYVLVLTVNMRLLNDIVLQEEKFSKAFMLSPYALTLTKLKDGLIIDLNKGFYQITGYTVEECRGKTIFDLHIWKNIEERAALIDELSNDRPVYGKECTFMNKNGGSIIGLVSACIIEISNELYVLSSINDITVRKKDEVLLRKSFEEKKFLLRELQHRAKNSFAMITGMVNLAAMSYADGGEGKALKNISQRIQVFSSLYDLLYSTDSIIDVRLDIYLDKIVASVQSSAEAIIFKKTFENVFLPVKTAASVGIMITELLTNAVKYAFPGGKKGTISVAMRKDDNTIIIDCGDDGIGLPEGFEISTAHSLGLILVESLASQMGGILRYEVSNGTQWHIEFPAE